MRARALSPTQHPPTPRRRSAVVRDGGFTLIEVLVSALLVVLIATAAAKALVTTTHTSADQRLRSQADGLATQDQERLRGLSDTQLASLSQSRPSTVNGTTFTVQSTSTYEDTTGATSCSSTAAAYYRIVSTVTWTEGFTNQPASIQEESLLSRPVTGDLLTQVTDQTGAAIQGVTITPSGPSTQTAPSDSNGCVMFAGLDPGLYSIGLSDSGYVDPNGNSAPTGTATVTTTGTAHPNGGTFRMGQAGSIVGTFQTSGGAGGEADGISWLGNKGSIPMSGGFRTAPTTDPSTPSTGFTTFSLFPFASLSPTDYTGNYTVWGGRCAGQAPPAPSPDQFTVTPGSVGTAQTIQEPLLNLQAVQYNNGSSTSTVTPADIVLTFSDGTCSDSWKATRASSMSATTGWLANPGQAYAPSGDLTVCVDYKPSGGNYYKASVTTGNTNFSAANAVPAITIVKSGTGSTTPPC
ncbi:MAG: carboxypeptidase-like regulatory domain-containing protein [Solirubrobacteraceae bacterium]